MKGPWINVALGIWLCLSSALIAHTPVAFTNNLFLGLSIFLVAFFAMGIARLRRFNTLLGAWAIVSPFALGYMNSSAALNDVLVGMVVVAVSLWMPRPLARRVERQAISAIGFEPAANTSPTLLLARPSPVTDGEALPAVGRDSDPPKPELSSTMQPLGRGVTPRSAPTGGPEAPLRSRRVWTVCSGMTRAQPHLKLLLGVFVAGFAAAGAACGGGGSPGSGSDGGSGTDGGTVASTSTGCGDGIVTPPETCDDGNTVSGDGCSNTCQIEPQDPDGNGWSCPPAGGRCTRTVCGDGIVAGNEQCDDGNNLPFDGCYKCRKQPDCPNGACLSVCGDGIISPGEECDDGNNVSGDGCSASCKLENIPGISCTNIESVPPSSVDVLVIYRDFKGFPEGGHPDFEHFFCIEPSLGLVQSTLVNGRPALAKTTTTNAGCGTDGSGPTWDHQMITSAASFAQWYQDTPGVNKTVVGSLTLARSGSSSTYVFDSAQTPLGNTTSTTELGFFPLDGVLPPASWGVTPSTSGISPTLNHDYGFTTELREPFTYQGGEVLNFTGDDDVWVFINGHLAVDLGGLHPRRGDLPVGNPIGSINLDNNAASLGIVKGGVYEISLFHAERHTDQSNFKLTLGGFVQAKTRCGSVCGDGIKAPDEACDDGAKTGQPGSTCSADCKFVRAL